MEFGRPLLLRPGASNFLRSSCLSSHNLTGARLKKENGKCVFRLKNRTFDNHQLGGWKSLGCTASAVFAGMFFIAPSSAILARSNSSSDI
jgi:hypothetical protein